MLSKVLSKDACADCRFCCSFRRCSLWETPLFDEKTCEKLRENNDYGVKVDFQMKDAECSKGRYGQMQLEYKYQTDHAEEEAACEFLDPNRGCVLSEQDKPFDCKIWPLRIMKKDEELVIALTPTCPALGKTVSKEMKDLVCQGLGKQIYEYAMEHPFMIKEYREEFPVIMRFEKK